MTKKAEIFINAMLTLDKFFINYCKFIKTKSYFFSFKSDVDVIFYSIICVSCFKLSASTLTNVIINVYFVYVQ